MTRKIKYNHKDVLHRYEAYGVFEHTQSEILRERYGEHIELCPELHRVDSSLRNGNRPPSIFLDNKKMKFVELEVWESVEIEMAAIRIMLKDKIIGKRLARLFVNCSLYNNKNVEVI